MTLSRLRRILLVEDEDDIREIASLALEAVGGFALDTCASGRDAVSKAKAFSPDLILLDVMMPGLDGPATLALLRADAGTREIPVVFVTAKVQPSEVAHYRSLGALDVLRKPFDPMKLAGEVEAIWTRAASD